MALGVMLFLVPVRSAQPKFFPDDPLVREPESQDASNVKPWDVDLGYDLAYNYLVTSRREATGIRAGNVNSIDEVADSSWFTNRIGARTMTVEDIETGPNAHPAPDPSSWTILREKSSGAAAGFTARDAGGATWFVSFDAPSNPEGATSSIVVATKLFHALGFNQVENHISTLRRQNLKIDPKASVWRPSGRRTAMTNDDLEAVLSRARPGPDGTYRITAGRALPGRILGGFKYEGTRPDDPNDVVEHQHRRELRALRVFGAWANLTDMKAGNTLDTLETSGGRSVVRHYLQDVGSTFGIGANGPHDLSEGWEYVVQAGPAFRRLFSLGFALSPWQTARYENIPAIGPFEGDKFEPQAWKPRAPVRAYREMQADDAFWAARRVAAFSDGAIRAAVNAGRYSDVRASEHLTTVLIKRRNRIAETYLPAINPIVDPVLDAAAGLSFRNAAVDHAGAAAPRRYTATWYTFDNGSQSSKELGVTTGEATRLVAPAGLPSAAGAYVRVDLKAEHDTYASWSRPIETYFRREPSGWKLVGLTRLPGR
jgi:hypothetical protein